MLYIPVYLVLFFAACVFQPIVSFENNDFVKNYPTPFTKNNRVLGMVLSFNHYHIDPIVLILNEYVSMCEAGWAPSIVLYTTVDYSPKMLRYVEQKLYCTRTNSSVPFRTDVHPPTISTGLGAQHRNTIAQEYNNFDMFVYHEDDIVFRAHHLSAYVFETKKFHEVTKGVGLREHLIGFQRYRRLNHGNDIHAKFGEPDIFEQELFEEMPSMQHGCMDNVPYLRIGGNIHQGMWALTKQQIVYLQERCSFLNQSSGSREYMSSFSLYDHKRYHCGMHKLIPGERLNSFMILHYFQQRHVSWTPVFFGVENVIAGFEYSSGARDVTAEPSNVPECWKGVVAKNLIHQRETASPTRLPTDAPTQAVPAARD